MKVKTAELIDAALDWAVAKCENVDPEWLVDDNFTHEHQQGGINYSTDWALAGPILDREGILCGPSPFPGNQCAAGIGCEWDSAKHIQAGLTPLTAAMRCFVASRLGDEIEVPDELMACSNREADASQDQANAQRPRSRA